VKSAYSTREQAGDIVADLREQLGDEPWVALVFFCHRDQEGAAIHRGLQAAYPDAEVVGTSTAGSFTDDGESDRGVACIGVPRAFVKRAASAHFPIGDALDDDVQEVFAGLSGELGVDLGAVPPGRFVGVVFIDGLSFREDDVNHAIGLAAPGVPFIGGSAGDDFALERTHVYHDGRAHPDASVVLLLEVCAPYTVMKTQSVRATDRELTVTATTAGGRVVAELDGRPALPAYAEAVGVSPSELGLDVFMGHPLALMLGDDAWLRSPIRGTEEQGIQFSCVIPDGAIFRVMEQVAMLERTRDDLRRSQRALGGEIVGGLVVNCAYRKMSLDATGDREAHRALFSAFPCAGFHSYGESYLGSVNQTCVALLFGAPTSSS
jgi:hypothetical protein